MAVKMSVTVDVVQVVYDIMSPQLFGKWPVSRFGYDQIWLQDSAISFPEAMPASVPRILRSELGRWCKGNTSLLIAWAVMLISEERKKPGFACRDHFRVLCVVQDKSVEVAGVSYVADVLLALHPCRRVETFPAPRLE